ncbi:MAG: bifunctional chorismate mutase/prephenate dehydratase [Oscillospiraceae bacterium]|nr:bifunctional chorismate mutase/prephenate dehydratase [Oscillospiraceae bacterium]MBQ7129509.1 bifunctional chorismate mutase/prephenate dehydratase [Oscillospiraceae bacterium]
MTQIRNEIDSIDDQLVQLFCKRMELSSQVAQYKKANNLPIFVPARERAILQKVAENAGPEMANYTRVLYSMLFELSRSYQSKLNDAPSHLYQEISEAIENTPRLFPQAPMVACQGVEGAYSQIACEKIFKNPFILYFKNFEGVFTAIEQGMCQYGILPIENSTAGSVNKVYDLMISHNFSIVRTFRLKVDHNLLAKPGTKLSDIKTIYSHEQAINQCAGFLHTLTGVNVIPVANTALASEMVSKSESRDVAALSSRFCADLYGLQCLASSVQDAGNNHTRFICISRKLEIYPGSDKTSIMMILPHKPGALYKVLARMYTLGINVIKLESRPLPDRDFEFMFYFDLETSIYSEEFIQLMCELEDLCEEFKYLGSYTEVV